MPRKRSKYYKKNLRKLSKLNLFSDFFMTICFDKKPKVAEKVLSIILNMPRIKVLKTKAQYSVTNILGRTVRLDVLATDNDGRRMNIEVQRDNTKAIPRRARYHSSILDTITFEKGQEFNELRDSYVIFITEHDYFGNKLPIYHIDRIVKETGKDFSDGSFIIYVNGDIRDDTPIGKLMHDFSCTKAQNMYYHELAEVVKYYKETEEGKEFMCQIIDEIRTEGKAEGIDNTIKAISLIKAEKYTLEEIASLSGLPVDKVKALQASLN